MRIYSQGVIAIVPYEVGQQTPVVTASGEQAAQPEDSTPAEEPAPIASETAQSAPAPVKGKQVEPDETTPDGDAFEEVPETDAPDASSSKQATEEASSSSKKKKTRGTLRKRSRQPKTFFPQSSALQDGGRSSKTGPLIPTSKNSSPPTPDEDHFLAPTTREKLLEQHLSSDAGALLELIHARTGKVMTVRAWLDDKQLRLSKVHHSTANDAFKKLEMSQIRRVFVGAECDTDSAEVLGLKGTDHFLTENSVTIQISDDDEYLSFQFYEDSELQV